MGNVTLVNPVGLSAPPLLWQHEQIQFLGLINLLTAAGHQVTFIDALGGRLGAEETAKRVVASRPDVLGVSCYFNREDTILKFDKTVLDRTRKALPGVRTWLGGPVMLRQIPRVKAVETLRPDVAVIGEGEIPIAALIANGLSHSGLTTSHELSVSTYLGATVLEARASLNLNSIDFKRPAGWPDHLIRLLDWQRFCLGACTFCAGQRRRPTYVSPERAREELAYLMAMGSRSFMIMGPAYTQDAEKATALTEEMLRQKVAGIGFLFEACVLEEARIVREFQAPWAALGRANAVTVYLGLETGVPNTLQRIGKVQDEDEAWRYLPSVLDILDKAPEFRYLFAWMLLSPWSTPATALFDLMIMRAIIEKYPHADMNPPSLMNNMTVFPGTKLFDDGLADWVKSAPPPIQALHAHMEALLLQKRGGPISRWIGQKVARKITSEPMSELSQAMLQAMRKGSLKKLGKLIEFLLKQMEPQEARQALSEARELALKFGDARILALFDSQKERLKGTI